MKKLRIACWSVGQHAIKNILPAIHNCNTVVLHGIFTRNREVAQKQSTNYNCINYDSHEMLLNDDQINAVYISSPTGIHYEQILQCINAGKSVLVEKSALTTFKEAKELVEIANLNGVLIMEAFMYRFHDQFITLKEIVKSKKYGDIKKIDIEFGFPHLKRSDIRYRKELDGGALFDAGAYTLSAARNLVGDDINVEWSKIYSEESYEVDTFGQATLTSGNIVLNCSWVFGANYRNQIRIWSSNYDIFCDRAFSKPSDYISKLIIRQNANTVKEIQINPSNHFIKMLDYFADIVMSNENKTEHSQLLQQSYLINRIRNNIKGFV